MAATPQAFPSQPLNDQNLMPTLTEDEIKEIAKAFSKGAFEVISSKLITHELLSEFAKDPFTQQLLLSIQVYTSYPFEKTKCIFPLIFLKAKMYMEINDHKNAIETLCSMKGRYESYNKDDTNADTVITFETFNTKFTYFSNFLVY